MKKRILITVDPASHEAVRTAAAEHGVHIGVFYEEGAKRLITKDTLREPLVEAMERCEKAEKAEDRWRWVLDHQMRERDQAVKHRRRIEDAFDDLEEIARPLLAAIDDSSTTVWPFVDKLRAFFAALDERRNR